MTSPSAPVPPRKGAGLGERASRICLYFLSDIDLRQLILKFAAKTDAIYPGFGGELTAGTGWGHEREK
jgi:hypothetical protein